MRAKPQISIRHIGEIAIFDITGYLTEDSGEDMDTAYEQSLSQSIAGERSEIRPFVTLRACPERSEGAEPAPIHRGSESSKAQKSGVKIEGATKILLSFDQKSFITSSGFGLIVKLLWKTRSNGQILRVAHPSEQVRKTFHIIGLNRSIEIFASESEALADF